METIGRLEYPDIKTVKRATNKQIVQWWVYFPAYSDREEKEQKVMIEICSRFNHMDEKEKDYYKELWVIDGALVTATMEEMKKDMYCDKCGKRI